MKKIIITFAIAIFITSHHLSAIAAQNNNSPSWQKEVKAKVSYVDDLYNKNGGSYSEDLIKASIQTADLYYKHKDIKGNLENAYRYYFMAMTGAIKALELKPNKTNAIMAANCAILAGNTEAELFREDKNQTSRYITSGTIEYILGQLTRFQINKEPIGIKLYSILVSTYSLEGKTQKIPPIIQEVKNIASYNSSKETKEAVEYFFDNIYNTSVLTKDYQNAILAAEAYKKAEFAFMNNDIDIIKKSTKIKSIYDMLFDASRYSGDVTQACQYAKKSYNITYYLYPNDLDTRRFEPFFSVAGICRNDMNTSAKYYAYKAYKNASNNSNYPEFELKTLEAKRLYED